MTPITTLCRTVSIGDKKYEIAQFKQLKKKKKTYKSNLMICISSGVCQMTRGSDQSQDQGGMGQ